MLKRFRKKVSATPEAPSPPPTPSQTPSQPQEATTPDALGRKRSSAAAKSSVLASGAHDRRHSSAPRNEYNASDALDRRRSSATKSGSDLAFSLPRFPHRHHISPSSSYGGTTTISAGDAEPSGLGLRVVYQPPFPALTDIIFVHGLGGQGIRTWCKDQNPALFWPSEWLPNEGDIAKARIFSFGYNAGYGPGSSKSVANIVDFAKDLLNEMQFGQNEEGNDLMLGRVPIVFIVHSMGGLVVKKAYLLGQSDKTYSDLIRSVAAIVFLGTPHRGSKFAEILNRILAASFQGQKGFIKDLHQQSPALEEINESFRHAAEKLAVWSFYETRAMKVAGQQSMIVEKESSILGYPAEISVPLDADHRHLVKFGSPDEANYIKVRNAIRSLVVEFASQGANALKGQQVEEARKLEHLLSLSPDEDDDFKFFFDRWVPGTCRWILQEPALQRWLELTPQSCVLWYNAPPGSGKSVISAFLIDYLRQQELEPLFFFFRFGDLKKRSLSACLQRLAYQLATLNRDFCASLQALVEEGQKLGKADAKLIWQKIFEAILLRLEFPEPLYWVIDGLDEAEGPDLLFDLLETLSMSRSGVHLLIVSRKTAPLIRAFDRLSSRVSVTSIDGLGHQHKSADIDLILEQDTKYMSGSDKFREEIRRSIVERAEGNLLWVRLVLQEMMACYTEEDVRATLKDIPDDMTAMYHHMETTIITKHRKANIALARSLLRWAVCCRRALRLEELSGALPGFLDLKKTILEVCSQFIIVDETGSVSLIHQTAREYLTRTAKSELAIDIREGHGEICMKTLGALSEQDLRLNLTQKPSAVNKNFPFVTYASTSWAYHFRQSLASPKTLEATVKFLRSGAVLTWIHALALLNQLDALVRAAKDLQSVASMVQKDNATKSPLLQKLTEVELLKRWSVDLVKVIAKFRKPLLEEPRAIYRTVPALCPTHSVIHEQFHQSDSVKISISGIPAGSWDDNLVRIMLPSGDNGAQITSAGSLLAVLGTSGATYVWDSRTFLEVCTLRHKEPVTVMCLSKKGDRLATYGLKTTKIWSIPSGQLSSCTPNVPDIKAMALAFANNDQAVFAGTDDKIVRSLNVDDHQPCWQLLCSGPSRQDADVENSFINSPMCVRFNGDRTQVGLSYRGFPLTVWSLVDNHYIGRSKRSKAFGSGAARPPNTWFAVDRFTFNPTTGHVIGVYRDGCLFKWDPLTDQNQEVQATADEVNVSSDGKLFVTSDTAGNIAIWSFAFMTKIYQLSSNDLVHGLTFSPDAQRFYDIRGRCINAWEPNALVRFAEREASYNDAASEEEASNITHTSEALLIPFEPITAIAANLRNTIFCAGNEEGVVHANDLETGNRVKIAEFLNFQCISHLAMSTDGQVVVAADLSCDIILKRFGQWTSRNSAGVEVVGVKPPKIDLQGHGIDQILLDTRGHSLLVTSSHMAHVWSVDDAKIVVSKTLETSGERRWVQHPTDADLFLGFGPDDVQVYRWIDLERVVSVPYANKGSIIDDETDTFKLSHERQSLDTILPDDGTLPRVTKVMLSQDGALVLVQIKGASHSNKRLLIFDISALGGLATEAHGALNYRSLPQSVDSSVEILLGVLSSNRLAFLDVDLWLCTFHLDATSSSNALKRHYFIPRDWATAECFDLSCMLSDGTLLCPKAADVAVVTYSWDQ